MAPSRTLLAALGLNAALTLLTTATAAPTLTPVRDPGTTAITYWSVDTKPTSWGVMAVAMTDRVHASDVTLMQVVRRTRSDIQIHCVWYVGKGVSGSKTTPILNFDRLDVTFTQRAAETSLWNDLAEGAPDGVRLRALGILCQDPASFSSLLASGRIFHPVPLRKAFTGAFTPPELPGIEVIGTVHAKNWWIAAVRPLTKKTRGSGGGGM